MNLIHPYRLGYKWIVVCVSLNRVFNYQDRHRVRPVDIGKDSIQSGIFLG